MPATPYNALAAGLLVLLQACASVPGDQATAAQSGGEGGAVPELTLNLPVQSVSPCAPGEGADYTLLDRGFSALAAGEHIEAVTYFQRYQRLEKSARAQWEAGIAIAYASMLPHSPFYDSAAASKSYQRLSQQQPKSVPIHENVLLMREALATFVAQQSRVEELQKDNAVLSADLEKREEAIRRLRELTLGQKGAAQ